MAEPTPPVWKKLNAHVSRYTPLTNDQPRGSNGGDPGLCLVFGWMDARFAHLAKYGNSIHQMFPSSSILIIQSSSSFFVSSQSAKEAALKPVVNTLLELATEGRLSSGILVHCFSNGGGFELMTLQSLLARTLPSSMDSTPVSCTVVLDSCPGNHGLSSSLSSMAPKNPVLYFLAAPIIAFLYGLFSLRRKLEGRLPIFEEMRSSLLRSEFLPPFVTAPVTRLYIYSASDDQVAVDQVEAHVAAARSAGLEVVTEKYAKSRHVSHAKTDGERYWEAVRNVWSEATARARL